MYMPSYAITDKTAVLGRLTDNLAATALMVFIAQWKHHYTNTTKADYVANIEEHYKFGN